MAKYVENFKDWAWGMYDEYMRISNSNTYRWKVFGYANRGNIKTILIDIKKGKCGTARVSEKEYIEEIGIGVAWARLRGYEVPKERKKTILKNLADYDKFGIITIENSVLIKIGDIPETRYIAAYDTKKGILYKLEKSTMVYKIN